MEQAYVGVHEGDHRAAIKTFFAQRPEFTKQECQTIYSSDRFVVTYFVQTWPNRSPAWSRQVDAIPDKPLTHFRIALAENNTIGNVATLVESLVMRIKQKQ